MLLVAWTFPSPARSPSPCFRIVSLNPFVYVLLVTQTDALTAAGVPCAKLDSTLEAHEVSEIYDQVGYISPPKRAMT